MVSWGQARDDSAAPVHPATVGTTVHLLRIFGRANALCRYLVEQLKSLATDTKAVGPWLAYWMSWTKGLIRYG